MSRHYFELRPKSLDQITIIAADMMRHLHTRQYLGKVIVVCSSPFATMRVARKQWLKLARNIQRQRASTLDADKILRRTYLITHMQHMQFVAKTPIQNPDAHVFFISPDQLDIIPLNCYTMYLTCPLTRAQLSKATAQLPQGALFVDYTNQISASQPRIAPKADLEASVATHWQQVNSFLASHHIGIATLTDHRFTHMDALNNALDILLGVSHGFLRVAAAFQHAHELAQPNRPSHALQQQYNTVALLAYRVQSLTPGITNGYSLRTYQEDETYFLHFLFSNANLLFGGADAMHRLRLSRLARAYATQPTEAYMLFEDDPKLDRPFFEFEKISYITHQEMHHQPQNHHPNVLHPTQAHNRRRK